MKTNNKLNYKSFKTLFTVAVLVATIGVLNAQPPRYQGNEHARKQMQGPKQAGPFKALDLTEDQQTQLKDIMQKNRKENMALKLDIEKKNIELKRLKLADNADVKAMEQTIDEMYKLKAKMAKNRLRSHNEMKTVLTQEQIEKLEARGMHARAQGGKHGPNKAPGAKQGLHNR